MKFNKTLPQSLISLLSLNLFNLPLTIAGSSVDDHKAHVATVAGSLAVAAVGVRAEGELIRDLKNINKKPMVEAFKNGTIKHPLLSVLAGASSGLVAWLTPWLDFNQAKIVGLAVTAFDMTLSEASLLVRAIGELKQPVENTRSYGGSVSMHEPSSEPELESDTSTSAPLSSPLLAVNQTTELSTEQKTFAKSVRNSSVVKLFALAGSYLAAEMVVRYAVDLAGAKDYVTETDIKLAAPALVNLFSNGVTRACTRLPEVEERDYAASTNDFTR
jgi:hypothetical protein